MTDQPEPLPQRTPGATFDLKLPATVHAPKPVIPTAPPAPLITTRQEQK